MTKTGLQLFAITLLLCACQSMPGHNGQHPAMYEQRKVLILIPQPEFFSSAMRSKRYASGARYNQIPVHVRKKINKLTGIAGAREVDGWPIAALKAYCVVIEISGHQNVDDVVQSLSAQPDVILAQPMNHFTGLAHFVSLNPDPYAELQFGEDLAKLQVLHKYSMGENVRIGVVDTAVDGGHPDLLGQVTEAVDFVTVSGPADQLHGTAIAGIVSARLNNGEGGLGIAPAAQLFVYGACKRDANNKAICNTFDLARGLTKALRDRVNIVNLSLSGPHDPLLELLLKELLRQGIIVIAATNPLDSEDNFPASMSGVIAAGSSHSSEAVRHLPIDSDLEPDHWYLRSERMSTRAGGGYQFFYGNSISTAGLTGLAALIHSRFSRSSTRQWLDIATGNNCVLPPAEEPLGEFSRTLSDALGCGRFQHMSHQMGEPDELSAVLP